MNRLMAGVGSFLIFYAISLTHPALVDAISGVRDGVIFIGALLLTQFKPEWPKEDFSGWQLISKTAGVCLVGAGLALVGIKSGGSTVAGPVDGSCKPCHRGLCQAYAMEPGSQYRKREIENSCLSEAGNKDAHRLDARWVVPACWVAPRGSAILMARSGRVHMGQGNLLPPPAQFAKPFKHAVGAPPRCL